MGKKKKDAKNSDLRDDLMKHEVEVHGRNKKAAKPIYVGTKDCAMRIFTIARGPSAPKQKELAASSV